MCEFISCSCLLRSILGGVDFNLSERLESIYSNSLSEQTRSILDGGDSVEFLTELSAGTVHPELCIRSRSMAMRPSSFGIAQRRVFHCGAFGKQSTIFMIDYNIDFRTV